LPGSTRTTRDRAKREANNHALNNHHHHNQNQNNSNSNSNNAHSSSSAANSSSSNCSNSNTQRTNSPAAHINNNNSNHNQSTATAAATATTASSATTTSMTTSSKATRNQQQREQQQAQAHRNNNNSNSNMDMDTSTESEGEAANGSTTGGTANSNRGATRKIWSDWCSSSKGKSSQSDDEENNNNNFSSATTTTTTTARNVRTTVTQKKRKKLTRKAAIASKSAAAAAAQREAAAAREAAAQAAAIAAATANSKDSSSKEDGGAGSGGGGGGVRGRKGRMKKGARGRKSLKIAGLDVLHKQTLLSTSHEVLSKKLPAAPGCVDQQLTSLLTRNMSHTELEIPEAPQDTPYALQILLDVFRSQYMAMIDQMKARSFVPNIKRQIQLEQERKQRIKNRACQLDKQIKVLIDDSVMLLKARMNELGINVTSPNDLITKAKEIVGRHKELQGIAKKIQSQVTVCELEQKRMLKKHLQHLPDYQQTCGTNGRTKLELPSGSVSELSETAAHELVLKEIANTLAQRKKLYAQVSSIEKEAALLEKAAEERRTAAALLAQGTNMILATSSPALSGTPTMMPATLIPAGTGGGATQPLQLTTMTASNSTSGAGAVSHSAPTTPSKSSGHASSRSTRRSRDHRTRSQEWPDVPDVGKIEESNPEVLAQKILETGRQIEAGKFSATAGVGNSYNNAALGAGPQVGGKQLVPPQAAHMHHHHHNNNNMAQYHEEVPTTPPSKKKQHARSSSSEHLPSVSIYVADSNLMPAPIAAGKHQQQLPQQQLQSPSASGNGLRSAVGMLPKCELPGARKSLMSAAAAAGIQESPKVANFEDRLKSIITSALNEDQEHRKAAAHQIPGSSSATHMHDLNLSSAPQQSSPATKRSKHSAASMNNMNQQQHAHQQMQMHHQQHAHHNHLPPLPPQAQPPNNLSNLITVATQGPTHLNANTTISPITPPLSTANSQYGSGGVGAGKYGGGKQQSSAATGGQKGSTAKYQQQQHNVHLQQQQQQQQHLAHLQQQQHAHYGSAAAVGASPADLAFHHRRRSSVSAASYEHYAAQQQQQQ
ncbi:PREDICTED: histone-lysine N-methyltransferase, H3 lysine-79 specific-like, partial [Rhagoletis zephyria]|uniref:histone-lysine N-methyltransferase, H3 lysine-79 specific-like n=1 Tax=Rhagoletis zephyria TaxID=28612 RepID=UPI000811340A